MRSLLAFLILPLLAHGQPPPGYYDPAAGLSGQQLRVALRDIIDGHTVLANSQLWSAYAVTDRKPNNTVWDVYSDNPGGTPAYVFNFVVNQCGTYAAEGDCFNREHTFPQSWFNGAPPVDTDLFHLYPTDAWVNQKRANWPYGKVTNPTWTSTNGSKLGPCAWPGCSGTVFEPIDAYKGDLARGYFYLLTRYYGSLENWPCPMMLTGEFLPWAESMLIAWHVQDPVSQKEIDRNNTIFTSLQGNRNPFIDQPQWVHAIWGPTAAVNEYEANGPRIWTDEDLLHVQLSSAQGPTDLSLFDMRGTMVLSERSTMDKITLTMGVSPGVYLAVVETVSGRWVQRVVR